MLPSCCRQLFTLMWILFDIQSTITIRQCIDNDLGGLFQEYGQSDKILNNFCAANFDFSVQFPANFLSKNQTPSKLSRDWVSGVRRLCKKSVHLVWNLTDPSLGFELVIATLFIKTVQYPYYAQKHTKQVLSDVVTQQLR